MQYDDTSLCDWCPTLHGSIVVTSSRGECPMKNSWDVCQPLTRRHVPGKQKNRCENLKTSIWVPAPALKLVQLLLVGRLRIFSIGWNCQACSGIGRLCMGNLIEYSTSRSHTDVWAHGSELMSPSHETKCTNPVVCVTVYRSCVEFLSTCVGITLFRV